MNGTKDIEFGTKSEMNIVSELRILFNDDTITKTINKYDLFDFIGENKFIELKTRRCKSNTYPTSIIELNKFDNLDVENNDYYLQII